MAKLLEGHMLADTVAIIGAMKRGAVIPLDALAVTIVAFERAGMVGHAIAPFA